MRKLLTGYVVSLNRRHKRHAPLLQNRYRSRERISGDSDFVDSVLTQADAYSGVEMAEIKEGMKKLAAFLA
jgi:hypothetical protein